MRFQSCLAEVIGLFWCSIGEVFADVVLTRSLSDFDDFSKNVVSVVSRRGHLTFLVILNVENANREKLILNMLNLLHENCIFYSEKRPRFLPHAVPRSKVKISKRKLRCEKYNSFGHS